MQNNTGDLPPLQRRRFLAGAAGSAGFIGALTSADTATAQTRAETGGVVLPGTELAQLRSAKSRRASSFDRTGANADSVRVNPGATHTLFETQGAGMITHIWFTISSRDEFHLKNLVLRAYWDGEESPSVEVPVGDFFGLSLGNYFLYQSALTSVASIKAMNAYFPMPFSQSARVTVSNEGIRPADSFYFNIDYVSVPQLASDLGRFHAQYRQATPNRGWTDSWTDNGSKGINDKKNLLGESNYVFVEAKGRGHLIGVTHGVLQNQSGWWGEGDEMAIVDGEKTPLITGTGTEDYYNGAWNFGGIDGAVPFAYWHNGAPYIVDPERVGGRYCLYRWHLENPITFDETLRFTIEHGHANHRSDSFFSTAFWYQAEPHAPFPALPKAEERIPRVMAVGGPAAASPSKNAASKNSPSSQGQVLQERVLQQHTLQANDCVLCVDIGGTTTKIGVLNWPEPVVAMEVIPTRGPVETFATSLVGAIERVRQAQSASCSGAVAGVGVALAGMLDDECTRLFYNPNIAWLEGFELRDYLTAELSLPVHLDADSTAATLAEAYIGSGRGVQRFMCVTVGTGIGVGMTLNGEPLRFAYGCMGDPGHIKVQPDGELCPCGGRGCAEVLVSAPVLAQKYQTLTKQTHDYSLRDVIEAGRAGDQVAIELLTGAGRWLGILSASLADTFFPECMAFAGGLAEAGHLVMEPVRAAFEQHASVFARERVRLERASLGATATLAGAAFSVLSAHSRRGLGEVQI